MCTALTHAVLAAYTYTTRTQGGAHKILETCNLPLTGLECVNRIITEMAVFDCTSNGLVLRELAPGVSLEAVRTATGMACDECPPLYHMCAALAIWLLTATSVFIAGAKFTVADDLKEIQYA
jgi:hypothetical protein